MGSAPGSRRSHASITQQDIAVRLGISRQLVGFALNGSPAVAVETRERVCQTAKELGYDAYSNREARALIGRRYGQRAPTGMIAILIPPFGGTYIRDIPYFAPFLDGAENEAARRGLDVLFCSPREHGLPRLIAQQSVDGVICVAFDPGFVRRVQALGLPVVNMGTDIPSVRCLVADDRAGAKLATEHLLALGHRRIAYLGHCCKARSGALRLQGYTETLRANGLDVREGLIDVNAVDQTTDEGAAAMERLLQKNAAFKRGGKPDFTALVCYNDTHAMGAVRRAQQAGLRVPRDLSVTGFDDTSLQLGFQPALTSVAVSRSDMGRRAIELLAENEAGTTRGRREQFPVTLIVRDSTCAPK